MQNVPILGSWSVGYKTATAPADIVFGVPPWPGPPGGPPFRYGVVSPASYGTQTAVYGTGQPNWLGTAPFTKLTRIQYRSGLTAHYLTVLRPKNWAVVTTAAAANATTLILSNEPGNYVVAQAARNGTTPGTGYRYPLMADQTLSCNTAAVTIASGHWCCVQLKSGQWHFLLASAWTAGTSTLTFATTPIPNVTGGGVAVGAVLFWFGALGTTVPTGIDPATGQVDSCFLTTASAAVEFQDTVAGLVTGLHPGDPLLIVSNNVTNDGFLEGASGVYSRY